MADPVVENAKKKAGVDKDGFITAPYPTDKNTFGDRSGEFPRKEYENTSSVNKSATSTGGSNYLDLSVSVAGVDVAKYTSGIINKYTDVQVIETKSGHVIEYNDTEENPRILIKHKTGSGMEMRPDGTIVVSSKGEGKVEVAHGGHTLIVTGDGQLHYGGDLTLNVGGDFNVNVGGSYNVQSKEETKTINGPSRDLYFGNKYTSIVGSRQDIMTENHSSAALGYRDTYTKGDSRIASEGGATIASKGSLTMSSESQMTQAAPDINIAAQSLSVFGDTGTIGGENIIMYNYNMYTGHSIEAGDTVTTHSLISDMIDTTYGTASTWEGNLEGVAKFSANSGVYTGPTTVSARTADATGDGSQPNFSFLAEYLGKGTYGIQKVFVDKGDHLKGAYDKTRDTGGVTSRILTTAETRAKMRDPGHRANSKFGPTQSSNGTISKRYNNTTPSGVSYVINPADTVVSGRTGITGGNTTVGIIPNTNLTAEVSVDSIYDPIGASQILTTTKLTNNITLSRFLRGKGDPGKLDPSFNLDQKKQLVRNLIPQAQLVDAIQGNKDQFAGYNLQIVEGVYVKEPKEVITSGGILDLRTQGRAVVYEVISPEGVIDPQKTVDLAIWIANNIRYEKIILDYDSYEPTEFSEEVLNAQIIVIMPEISADFKATFKMEVETLFNNVSQGKEFIAIGEKIPSGLTEGVDSDDLDVVEGDEELPLGGEEDFVAVGSPLAAGPETFLPVDFATQSDTETYIVGQAETGKINNGYSYIYDDKQYYVTVDQNALDEERRTGVIDENAIRIDNSLDAHITSQSLLAESDRNINLQEDLDNSNR